MKYHFFPFISSRSAKYIFEQFHSLFLQIQFGLNLFSTDSGDPLLPQCIKYCWSVTCCWHLFLTHKVFWQQLWQRKITVLFQRLIFLWLREVFLFLLFHFQHLTSIGLLTYTVTHVLSLDNEYSWSWFTTVILHVGKWHLTTRFKCGAKEWLWSFHNGWVRGWEMCKASHSLHTLVCDEKRLDSEILGHSFFCLFAIWVTVVCTSDHQIIIGSF